MKNLFLVFVMIILVLMIKESKEVPGYKRPQEKSFVKVLK